jgi:hypothetical protein
MYLSTMGLGGGRRETAGADGTAGNTANRVPLKISLRLLSETYSFGTCHTESSSQQSENIVLNTCMPCCS